MNPEKIKNLLSKNNYDFHFMQSVDSTMLEIKKINLKRNMCLMANEQKKGYGRRGASWKSPKGNVYISMLLKNEIPIENHFIYNAFFSNIICNVIEDICKIKTKIKWPNDILINDKKISGIISEIYQKNNNDYIIIGFGVNILSSPKIDKYPTTNTNEFNKAKDSFYFVYKFIEEYLINLNKLSNGHKIIMKNYKERLLYLKSNIKLKISEENFKEGIFHDLNTDGSIILKNKDNFEKIYNARIIK